MASLRVDDGGAADVVVAGAGPAGLGLATELTRRGLAVVVVDPHPGRPWRATHCGWADELAEAPGIDPVRSVRIRHRAVVVDAAGRSRALSRPYAQLDPAGAPAALRHRAAAGPGQLTELAGRVATVGAATARGCARVEVEVLPARGDSPSPRLTARLTARLVVDAAGGGGGVAGATRPAAGAGLWQWAVGLVARFAPPPVPTGGAVLMDWRQYRGRVDDDRVPPSFGYVLDRGDGTHLVEETVLAGPRVPGVMRVLRSRLAGRLAAAGWRPVEGIAEELVAIPLDIGPRAARGPVLPVGVAAGLVHPASGYSVTAALRTAPAVADAVATALADPATDAAGVAAAGSAALWTPDIRRAHHLLARGVRSTLGLDATGTAGFYDTFFTLPTKVWSGYLAQPPASAGVVQAMARMFLALPPADARRLVRRWSAAR